MIIYSKIDDAINKQMFEVRKPASYEPYIGPLLARPDAMPPLYEPNGMTQDISFMPVKFIVDMCFQDVEFTIVRLEDVQTIVTMLHTYLHTMEPYRKSNPDINIFYDRATMTFYKIKEIADTIANITAYKARKNKPTNVNDILGRLNI